ncbi:MAG TPA: hypothetical protein VG498_24340 [Terriglobales bacterium]|nr:hypothetical protein [Terriglobales bacterium]
MRFDPWLEKRTYYKKLRHMSSTDQSLTLDLLSAFKDIPALVEVYIEIVDEVMLRHGFDRLSCQFTSAVQSARPATRLQPVRGAGAEEESKLALAV